MTDTAGQIALSDAIRMARTRLEGFADDAYAGRVQYSARELKRKIWVER